MADRGVIFSGPMVRALLDGKKSQTRRALKPQPRGAPWFWEGDEVDPEPCWFDGWEEGRDSYGQPEREVSEPIKGLRYAVGDRIYVREAHALVPSSAYRMSEGAVQAIDPADRDRACIYREDWTRSYGGLRWRPSIHMPRWASRLTLIVTDVRVQRLQEISREDAIAEGLIRDPIAPALAVEMGCDWGFDGDSRHGSPISAYAALWNSLHGPDAWDANPWVCALIFTVHRCNIDQMGAA